MKLENHVKADGDHIGQLKLDEMFNDIELSWEHGEIDPCEILENSIQNLVGSPNPFYDNLTILTARCGP